MASDGWWPPKKKNSTGYEGLCPLFKRVRAQGSLEKTYGIGLLNPVDL